MTHTSEAAMDVVEQIKRDEGLRLIVYFDSVGIPTIGYGRNLKEVGITQDEADYLLANDIAKARLAVATNLPWTTELSECRQAVLIGMAFNMGLHGLLTFNRTLDLIEHGRWDEAADAMMKSRWAAQVGPRAYRLSQQLRTNTWT